MTCNQITNLDYDRGSRRFEEELVEYSSIEDVDENLVSEFKQLLDTNVDNEKLLKARGFMREGKLTVAGLLLFSNNINVYLPSARIRFMRYEGTKEDSGASLTVVQDVTFDKALRVAIREARCFITTQLREYTFLGKEGSVISLLEYHAFAL
ncbi:ATP-dependent DNA helicase RecG, partial [Staphylococcus pseudintermedius]